MAAGGVLGRMSFAGDKINWRGLRWEFYLYATNATPGGTPDVQFRFTVYRINTYGFGYNQIGPSAEEVTPEASSIATWYKWRTEFVDVLYQRKFKMDNNGNRTSLLNKKFWVKANRKLVSADEDLSGASFDTFGEVKGGNIYWALEVFAPGSGNLGTEFTGNIVSTTYFKDA